MFAPCTVHTEKVSGLVADLSSANKDGKRALGESAPGDTASEYSWRLRDLRDPVNTVKESNTITHFDRSVSRVVGNDILCIFKVPFAIPVCSGDLGFARPCERSDI